MNPLISIISLVRRCWNNAELIIPDVMTTNVHRGLRKLLTQLIERGKRSLRKWQQNVQWAWQDGLVGKREKIWLPTDGHRCWFEINGHNLAIARQLVSSGPLEPEEPFVLGLLIPAGQAPVKLELLCEQVIPVDPLDPRYGARRAGCRLDAARLGKA